MADGVPDGVAHRRLTQQLERHHRSSKVIVAGWGEAWAEAEQPLHRIQVTSRAVPDKVQDGRFEAARRLCGHSLEGLLDGAPGEIKAQSSQPLGGWFGQRVERAETKA